MEGKTNYKPEPIDTSGVKLDKDLEKLCEAMAKNVHDNWAKARIEEGWKYGPVRDDARKEHPCLVAYEELPEEEKEYDRKTSQETLKFILLKGYEIKPK